jgi:two-component system sensor histidine kinase YesM
MIKKLLLRYRKKVFYKIFLLLLLATSLPAVILTTMSHESTRSLFQSDFIDYKKTLNNQIATSIDENLQSMQKQSEALVYNILDIQKLLSYEPNTIDEGYFEAANRVNYYLTSILSNNDRFDGIGLLALSGSIATYVNSSGFTPKENSKLLIPGFEDSLDNNGGPVIALMDLDQMMNSSIRDHKNNNVIGVLRTLIEYKLENKPIGISLFTQELSKFGEIVTRGKITDEDTVIILSDTNKVVYSNREYPDTLQQLLERIGREREDKTNQTSLNWKDQYIIYSDSSIFKFKVITSVPRHVIEQKLSVVKRINVLLMTVLVISTVILSILLSNFITSPLVRLKKSFLQFQRGNFTIMIEAKGADEFAEITIGFNKMAENVQLLIKEKYEIELARRQSELESLQSKINPHFLYNTLSSIKAVIRDENASLARQMVQHLSDLFRYSLNRGKFIVTLVEELDHVKKYLTLQKLRFGEQFQMTFEIDDDLLTMNILRLTIQPIVENAILHGLEDKTGTRHVQICAQTYDNELWIYVEDNGKGMDSGQVDEMNTMLSDNPRTMLDSPTRDRVGIYNVNSRIKLYYGNEYGISIQSAPDEGTIVKIILPLDRRIQL